MFLQFHLPWHEHYQTPIKNIAYPLCQSIFPSQKLQRQTGAEETLCTGIYPLKEGKKVHRPVAGCSLERWTHLSGDIMHAFSFNWSSSPIHLFLPIPIHHLALVFHFPFLLLTPVPWPSSQMTSDAKPA